MPPTSSFALFAASALVLLAIPGPAVLYVIARSVAHGRRAGLVSVLGIHTGSLVHITAAVAGLSSLLAASAVAFGVVRYAGAAYLIVLGVRRLLDRRPALAATRVPDAPLGAIYRQGFVVNVLNPKTALFFLAFLPQFVAPGRDAVALQVAVLGLVFTLLGLVTDTLWALAAGGVAGRLRRSPRFTRAEPFVSGGLLVGLGISAAAAGGARHG